MAYQPPLETRANPDGGKRNGGIGGIQERWENQGNWGNGGKLESLGRSSNVGHLNLGKNGSQNLPQLRLKLARKR